MASSQPVTLITGSRKGIGKFLAEHYVKLGHLVVGCSRGEADWKLEGYTHFKADVQDEKNVQGIFLQIRKQFGRLDHLLNNAGIAAMNHAMLTPLSTVERVLATNVIGTFLFCREAARLMQRQKFGRIVNFSTVAVPLKLEGEAIYAASKAAVNSLTVIMARELAPMGITVNAIGPTPIETDLIRNVPKEKIQELLQRLAIPRLGTLEDVTNVCDFFLKKESQSITGQIIYLGGAS
jgi:3-oxoacyl-[acyl-carrier protein] reductase